MEIRLKSIFILFFVVFTGCSFQPKVKLQDINVKKFKNLKYDNVTFDKKWYEYFNDDQLNNLINTVLEKNINIKIAIKNIEIANQQIVQRRSFLSPNISLEGSRIKNKQHLHDLPKFIPSVIESRVYNAKVIASYEVDFWGKYRNLLKSANHSKNMQDYILENVKQTILSNLVISYYNIKFLKKELAVTKDIIKSFENETKVVKDRYLNGLVDVNEIIKLDYSIENQKTFIPILKSYIELNKYIINVLLGNEPEKNIKIDDEIPEVNILKIPADLPSEVLLRRPDINMEIEKIKAQANFVGYRKADLFPAFKLTGVYGFENEDLKSLIRNSSSLYSWITDIFVTVFDYGRKRAIVREEKVKFEQLKLEYYQKVLNVLKDVEFSLNKFHSLIKKEKFLNNQLKFLEIIIKNKYEDYEKGIADIRELFALSREKKQVEIKKLDNENEILTIYVKCLKELGY